MPKKYLIPIIGIIILLLIISAGLVFTFRDKIFPTSKVQELTQTQTSSQTQNTETKTDPEVEKTVQKMEIKPLVADTGYDVVVFNECDLAIKYNKNQLKPKLENKILSFKNLELDPSASLRVENEEFGTEIKCQDTPFDYEPEKGNGGLNKKTADRSDFLKKLGVPQAENFKQNLYLGGNSDYYFKLNGKYYQLFQALRAPNDYIIQPNSLAPSTPSVKL